MRGGVTDRYPANLAAIAREMEHERELRRHQASDEAIARRAAELDGRSFESDGHIIRPAASVQEMLDEANAQSNCVAGFIDKYARGDTEICTRGATPRFGSCAAPTAPTSRSSP